MLLRHTLLYGVGQVLMGIISFVGLGLYTRLVAPSTYGEYAVVLATSIAVAAALFSWLRVGFLRFASGAGKRRLLFLVTGLVLLTVIIGAIVSLTVLIDFTLDQSIYGFPLTLLALCVISIGASEFFLTVVRTSLRASLNLLINIVRATSAVVISYVLLKAGWQGLALLVGVIASHTLASIIALYAHRSEVRSGRWSQDAATRLWLFGWPISVTAVFRVVATYADRMLLITLIDAAAAGVYAVSYDLTRRSLYLLMSAISMAGLPLTLRALDQFGIEEARAQMSKYFTLLMGVSLPAVCGLWLIGDNLCSVLIGEQFSDGAALLVPMVAVATFLNCVQIFYTDFAFEIAKRPIIQLPVIVVGIIVNIISNLIFIPWLGIVGAGYSAVLSNAISLLLSGILSRQAFPLEFPVIPVLKIVLSCLIMSLCLWPILDQRGAMALMGQIILGGSAYGLVVVMFDIHGIRQIIIKSTAQRLRG